MMERVEIRWPVGNVETLNNLAADFIYTVVEGKGAQSTKPLPPPDSAVTLSAKPQ